MNNQSHTIHEQGWPPSTYSGPKSVATLPCKIDKVSFET